MSQYQALLDQLESEVTTKEDAYQKLLKTESNVLNLLNRVADQRQETAYEEGLILSLPIPRLLEFFATTWKVIIHEMIHVRHKSWSGYAVMLFQGDRKIIMGMTLVVIAALLFFIEISV